LITSTWWYVAAVVRPKAAVLVNVSDCAPEVLKVGVAPVQLVAVVQATVEPVSAVVVACNVSVTFTVSDDASKPEPAKVNTAVPVASVAVLAART
jgi:hypothetical protein